MANKSLNDAEREVRAAVKDYDWIKELLGEVVFSQYALFKAQLKGGDSLKVKVSTKERQVRYSEFNSPCLEIILVRKDKPERRVALFDVLGYVGTADNLLYDK